MNDVPRIIYKRLHQRFIGEEINSQIALAKLISMKPETHIFQTSFVIIFRGKVNAYAFWVLRRKRKVWLVISLGALTRLKPTSNQ
jgi:hypothetical protein